MSLIRTISRLISFVIFPPILLGFSCIPFHDHFFFRCTGEDCIPEFEARETQWLGGCSRQLIIDKFPLDFHFPLKSFLFKELNSDKPIGIYRLSLENFGPLFPHDLQMLESWLELKYPPIEIKQLSPIATQEKMKEERAIWELQALADLKKEKTRKVIDYLSIGLFLIFIGFSLKKFYLSLKQLPDNRDVLQKVSRNMGIQYLFLVFFIFISPIMWSFDLNAIYGIPLLILILFLEIIIYFVYKKKIQDLNSLINK